MVNNLVFVLFNLVLFSNFISLNCLYEDQVGKFDWKQSYVGELKELVLPFKPSQNSIIFSTHSQVITSLYIRNGSIEWRHRLESPIELFASASGTNGCDLITINSNGKWIRGWTKEGLLVFERSFPNDFIENIQADKNVLVKYFLKVNQKSSEIIAAKFLWTNHQLEISRFDLKTLSLSKNPIVSIPWMTSSTSCEFISSNHLLCVDSADISIKSLLVSESNSFTTIPLTSFGLQTATKPKFIKIHKLPYQELNSNPYFALDLGGDGFILLKYHQNQITLVKVLPKITLLTIAPTENTIDKLIVWVLIFKENPAIVNEDRQIDQHPQNGIKLAAFELDTWNEIPSLSSQFIINTKLIINNMFIVPFKHGSKYNYKLFLSSEDGQLIMSNLQGKVNWQREEALASVVSAEILDLPLSEEDAQIEQTFSLSQNIFSQLLNRIQAHVYQIQLFCQNTINQFINTMSRPSKPKIIEPYDESNDNSETTLKDSNDAIPTLVRDKFSLHRIIVTLTSSGKIFGIDSKSGRIVWSVYENELKNDGHSKINIYVQRSSAHYPYPAHCTVISKNGFVLSFDPITGNILNKLHLKTQVIQTMLMSHHDIQSLKPIIIVDKNLNPIIYPSSSNSLFVLLKDVYFMLIADPTTASLFGLSFGQSDENILRTRKVWEINLPNANVNNLQVVFKRYNEHVHSQGRVMGDRNVLYKYLNPNLVVVVTESTHSQEKVLNLYLIDAITGAIIFSTVHKRAKGPVNIVHSENWIIYSYYNEKSRRTEISSIELYEGTTQSNTTSFSSLTRQHLTPAIIEHQSYIFPTGINFMTDTITQKGITNKHILIALSFGGLLELPRAFLDPRRPLNPTLEEREEGLIPYIPELPIPSEGIINYNQTLTAISGIQTATTNLESTCLLFAYGLDLFYTRVTPSKTFDILKDDFDHLLISAVLIGIIFFSFLAKYFAAKKSLKAAWK